MLKRTCLESTGRLTNMKTKKKMIDQKTAYALLKACKEAEEVLYATINKKPASLSITWHTVNDAINKAEGRA